MSAVVLVLTIGVINLCLGYMAAVRLGFGPPTLLDAWAALTSGGVPVKFPHEHRRLAADTLLADHSPEPATPDSRDQSLEQTPAGEADEGPEEILTAEELDEMFGVQAAAREAARTPGTAGDEDEDATGHAAVPATENSPNSALEALEQLDDAFAETAVLKLNMAILRSTAALTKLEQLLRAVRGRTDEATIRKVIEQLKEDCRTFLAEHEEAAERFRQHIDELGEMRQLGERIEMAALEQVAQIETTLSNLDHMDFRSDLEAANARLLDELSQLRKSRHRLRDDQEQAFLIIAEHCGRTAQINQRLGTDGLTGLPNRIGLQTKLWEWWSRQEHRKRQMVAALFDLDDFGSLNERCGSWIADAVLRHLAEQFRKQVRPSDVLARFAGQRLAMITLDIGPRAATKQAELIRQTAERITFSLNGQTFTVTLSAAVTEVTADDAPETVFQRLEAAMKQAKRSGGNRCCFHTGEKIEPVESPNLGAPHTEIELDQHA